MIGIHIKTKHFTNLNQSLKYASKIGCTHIQMFNEDIPSDTNLKTLIKKHDLQLVIHSPYIINIAAPYDKNNWRTKYFLMEVENSIKNGAFGIVVHLGKRLKNDIESAYTNMYNILERICKKYKDKIEIYLETTAGQGTELCYKLEDLQVFYDKIKNNENMQQVKICLDTCHLFAAGYDLKTKKSVNAFLKKVDETIGLDRVGLIHLNDSLNDINSHKDRHTNIGNGYIGLTGLKYIYEYFSQKNIPCILETPYENYENEIASLISDN